MLTNRDHGLYNCKQQEPRTPFTKDVLSCGANALVASTLAPVGAFTTSMPHSGTDNVPYDTATDGLNIGDFQQHVIINGTSAVSIGKTQRGRHVVWSMEHIAPERQRELMSLEDQDGQWTRVVMSRREESGRFLGQAASTTTPLNGGQSAMSSINGDLQKGHAYIIRHNKQDMDTIQAVDDNCSDDLGMVAASINDDKLRANRLYEQEAFAPDSARVLAAVMDRNDVSRTLNTQGSYPHLRPEAFKTSSTIQGYVHGENMIVGDVDPSLSESYWKDLLNSASIAYPSPAATTTPEAIPSTHIIAPAA